MTVCAEFRTGTDRSGEQRQPDRSVVEVVGRYGEALKGSRQANVFGSATANPAIWLETKTTVELESHVVNDIADL
ncbi:hypothetical protein BH23CHL6_BH23CHL6_08360 [soil metagenome]